MTREPRSFNVTIDNETFLVYIDPAGCIDLSEGEDEDSNLHVCGLDSWNKLDEMIRDHLQ